MEHGARQSGRYVLLVVGWFRKHAGETAKLMKHAEATAKCVDD